MISKLIDASIRMSKSSYTSLTGQGHYMTLAKVHSDFWGGRVVRWRWVNFQCRSILLTWIRVGQGPTTLAVGANGVCLDIFSLIYHSSFLSPSLWETARHRLKYCLKGPLRPKQPTNQITQISKSNCFFLKYCMVICTAPNFHVNAYRIQECNL